MASYTAHTWQNGDSITATLLNNLETGVANASNDGLWTNLTPVSNGWGNYGTSSAASAQYKKDAHGRVWLRGNIKNGTIGATAFTLPAGFRPLYHMYFATNCYNGSANVFGQLEINTDGTIVPKSGANQRFSFDGISFDTVA
jgi:hypothetical protein